MKHLIPLLFLAAAPATWADPSLAPQRHPIEENQYVERHRIVTDLDLDGADDLILSHGVGMSGMSGPSWEVYLRRGDEFKNVGWIHAHPLAIAFEPDQGRFYKEQAERRHARIWVYLKSNGSSGAFGYFRVGEESVDDLHCIDIYPGDGGTPLGNALTEAAFEKDSPIPYLIEISTTSPDGQVTWKTFPGPKNTGRQAPDASQRVTPPEAGS